ncbi:carbamoyltransferase HypF [Acerihabitans arboris]|uniref:carbamoyltransferase HypF n=1 Tax=Acerihabitans arboris TaxID=2691583 RepID=UPI001FE472F9|nr:carbamoyltransferase HypF [Acerihabitans arboris]
MAHNGILIRITGKVQGVGFRPTVWQVAHRLGLTGDVGNNAGGVEVRLWGHDAARFIGQLRRDCPKLAAIDGIEILPWHWARPPSSFTIIASRGGAMKTQVVPDAATCDDCLAELNDPANRRFRYPFINCTHCGPRFTLIRRMPYDRPNTAMDRFPQCPDCLAEYQDPAERRFHAQPNACPTCGPQVWLAERLGGRLADNDAAITEAARRLLDGEILAVKGLGGFHLACDATNGAAVARLRARKHRPSKPLAVMMPDSGWLRRCLGRDDPALVALLRSPAAPIVLAPLPVGAAPSDLAVAAYGAGCEEAPMPTAPVAGASADWPMSSDCAAEPTATRRGELCDGIAPGLHEIGVMLPASPLQHLLLQRAGRPLVMTSGNLNGRPPALTNRQALEDLASIADGWLLHDRDIVQRADDSLVRLTANGVEMLRRSRGYVPDAITLPPGFAQAPAILAMGADLKNTFCLLRDGQAVLSQHLGDLADEGIHCQQRQALALFNAIWDFTPGALAVDAHPGYLSRRWGEALALELHLPCETVLHHHAHLAACLGEHGWPLDGGPVIGLALDGLGYGGERQTGNSGALADSRESDNGGDMPRDGWPGAVVPGDDGPGSGGLWGGECLKVDYRSCEWQGGLPAVALPGGDLASSQPWRNLLAQWLAFVPDWRSLPEAGVIPPGAGELLARAVARGINAPPASSTGRLFDAVAASLGLCAAETSWEGEAACRLEALAWRAAGPAWKPPDAPAEALPGTETIAPAEASPVRVFTASAATPAVTLPVSIPLLDGRLDLATFWRQWLAWRAGPAERAYGFHLALARGFAALARQAAARHGLDTVVLSGGVLHNRLFRELLARELHGLRVLAPARLPAGDGGLALGQALIAAARLLR